MRSLKYLVPKFISEWEEEASWWFHIRFHLRQLQGRILLLVNAWSMSVYTRGSRITGEHHSILFRWSPCTRQHSNGKLLLLQQFEFLEMTIRPGAISLHHIFIGNRPIRGSEIRIQEIMLAQKTLLYITVPLLTDSCKCAPTDPIWTQ